MNVTAQRMPGYLCFCWSSVLLEQLKPVLCIVRTGVSSINSLAVVCEKHQVLPRNKKQETCGVAALLENIKAKKRNPHTLRSAYPITDSGDDAVKVLDFALQQNHSGFLSAVLVGMVQHHVKKVTELGSDAGVLESWNKYLHSISKRNTFFLFSFAQRSCQTANICTSGQIKA